MKSEREVWIDNIKVVACVLVLLGHLLQSMVRSGIVSENEFYHWFNQTIYYFHVPLFFICSGYLYQKLSCVDSIDSWRKNVLKKVVALGVPYITFTLVTWCIKTIFSGNAGYNEVGTVGETLFLCPIAPYWYLYILFFCFVITPTFQNVAMACVGGAIAFVLKMFMIFEILQEHGMPYALSGVCENEIWFVIGMCLCVFKLNKSLKLKQNVGIGGIVFFIAMSIWFQSSANKGLAFLLGLLACMAFVLLFFDCNKQNRYMKFLAQYTVPIFLMHSIFAATFRSILMKVGITSAVVHIMVGILVSVLGPVMTAKCMKALTYPEFLLYPGKFIKKYREV